LVQRRTKTLGRRSCSPCWTSAVLSLRTFTGHWFPRAPSSRHPPSPWHLDASKVEIKKDIKKHEDNTQRPRKRTVNHGLEVVRGVLCLLLGSLQLLLQEVHLLLRLTSQSLLHVLDLLRGFDLGL
jgi:hypothetical protein